MSKDSSGEYKSEQGQSGKHSEAAGAHGRMLSEVSLTQVHKSAAPEAKALAAGGLSCDSNWSKMVAQWVTKNEGGEKYLVYNSNDHGQGISVGLLQWNQRKGRLPELLQAWHAQDPKKFNHLFGRHAAEMLRADSVRVADFNNDRVLHSGMLAALADREFQQVQAQLRSKHIVHSCEVAQSHDFKSLRGRAVVADLYNQLGETGTVRALNDVPRGPNESIRIEQLKAHTGHRIHGGDRVASIEDNVKAVWRKLGSK
jgi:hypothetical protein